MGRCKCDPLQLVSIIIIIMRVSGLDKLMGEGGNYVAPSLRTPYTVAGML